MISISANSFIMQRRMPCAAAPRSHPLFRTKAITPDPSLGDSDRRSVVHRRASTYLSYRFRFSIRSDACAYVSSIRFLIASSDSVGSLETDHGGFPIITLIGASRCFWRWRRLASIRSASYGSIGLMRFAFSNVFVSTAPRNGRRLPVRAAIVCSTFAHVT